MARIVPSVIGTSVLRPVRLSVMVSVSAIGIGYLFVVVGGLGGSSIGSSAQRARSCSRQRSLQNGRQGGATGWRLQNTHNSTFSGFGGSAIAVPNPDYIDF